MIQIKNLKLIKENLKQANILFKNILVHAIAYDKKISVSYF